MEKSGAVPDSIIWPQPGDQEIGLDRQLNKAIELLTEEIKAAPKQ